MYKHWQNLDDSIIKKHWKHGRAWIGRTSRRTLNIEWVIPNWTSWRIGFGVNDGDGNNEIHFSFGIGLFTLYLSLPVKQFHIGYWTTDPRMSPDKPFFMPEEREFSVYLYGGALWLSPWVNPMESKSKDPWWKKTHCYDFLDMLFGRYNYNKEVIDSGETLIPMPEGNYLAKYEKQLCTWKRPRSPFKLQRIDWWFDIPKGIPHEGKGENSWDCGEDALMGMGSGADSLSEAVGHVTGSALHYRERYGWAKAPKNLPIINL